MIRPEVLAMARRWGELWFALGLGLVGLWLIWQGGWVLVCLGGAALLLALGWGWLAIGRARFAQAPEGPGLVEWREAELAYFGPGLGGAIGLGDLIEIKLVTLRGRRLWWLKGAEAGVVMIPVDALGNEVLFDAFSTLPGLSQAALLSVLAAEVPGTGALSGMVPAIRPVWRRSGQGLAPV